MKIMHIITRLILGGAQQNTVMCCAAQTKLGHDVQLVYGPIYGPEGSLLDAATQSGATLRELRWMRRAVLPPHDYLCYRALRKLIRQTKPDIVHTHSSKAGIVGRAAAWAEHVPGVVHTVHGLPFHERQPRWVSRAYIAAERWAARRCHRIIGITEAMCSEFQAHNIGRPEQFDVVPSGVDVEAFTLPPEVRPRMRQELGIPQDAAVVGIVARLDKLKGQEDLVRIMPDLLKARPDARLLIVGDGWFRPQLDALVAELNVKDRVIFAGLVPPARVPEFIAAMDVHALPSYQEGQSRTLVQALLAGVPVVGYDAGGIKNVCLHERTGLLVPVGDQPGLCAALTRMLRDDALRHRLGRDGQAFAREHYDAQVMYSKLQAIYEQMLATRA